MILDSKNKYWIYSLSAAAGAAFLIFLFFFLFPAFAGRISIPSQIDLGGYRLRIYSLTTLLGVLAAFFAAKKIASRFSLSEADLENLVLLSVLGGLVGARAHHVLSMWDFYAVHPDFIWQFWRGGLGFFGGIIGASAAAAAYGRMKKLDLWKIYDLLAVSAPLGQAVGRWGNFFNQEAYGLPTSLPWKLFVSSESRLPAYLNFSFFHPAFLYESLLNLLIFILMVKLSRRRLPKGALFASYIIFYSLVRFFLEPYRADANLFLGFFSNQLLALAFMALAAAVMFSAYRRRENQSSGKN